MRVGALAETITVTGETPVVDVQSARREVVLNKRDHPGAAGGARGGRAAQRDARPDGRHQRSGVVADDDLLQRALEHHQFDVGGRRRAHDGQRLYRCGGAQRRRLVVRLRHAERRRKSAITVGGGLGESDIGGPVMNMVPRSGGNTFAGSAFFNPAGELVARQQPDRRAQGAEPEPDADARHHQRVRRQRSRTAARSRETACGSTAAIATLDTQTAMEGINANANAGDPSRWDWVGSPISARLVQDRQMIIGRLTAQVGKNRLRFNSEYQHRCEGTPLKVDTQRLPQPRRRLDRPRQQRRAASSRRKRRRRRRAATSTCRSTSIRRPGRCRATSKLLFEAGYTPFRYNPIFGHPPPDGITNLIPVTEQSNAINPATGLRYAPAAELPYRGVEPWGWAVGKTDGWQATASYVTGAHNMKVGYQGNRLDQLDQTIANDTELAYRFNQGVPNAVSYWLPDFGRRTITNLHGVFVQDSWTRGRLTLQGALRYDRAVELRAGRTQRHHR